MLSLSIPSQAHTVVDNFSLFPETHYEHQDQYAEGLPLHHEDSEGMLNKVIKLGKVLLSVIISQESSYVKIAKLPYNEFDTLSSDHLEKRITSL